MEMRFLLPVLLLIMLMESSPLITTVAFGKEEERSINEDSFIHEQNEREGDG
jgi:hypothetical protein